MRVSLAQTGRWLAGMKRSAPEEYSQRPAELPPERMDELMMSRETPFGRLRYFGPCAQLARHRAVGSAPQCRWTTTSRCGSKRGGDQGRHVRAPPSITDEVVTEKIGTLYAFKYRDFRLVWLGSAFQSAAMWIQLTTMGWLSYDLTGSAAWSAR